MPLPSPNKETVALNYTLDQLDLTDFYITFCPKAIEYIFKCTWNVLQDTSHPKPQKTTPNLTGQNLNQAFFSNHDSEKLEINYRGKKWRKHKHRLNNIPLRNQRINEEIKDKIRKYLETNVSETQIYKSYEM